MTRKELQETREKYRNVAEACLDAENPYAMITNVCKLLANEMCYNHHERGQRIWAFFQALKDVEDGHV